MIEFTFNDSGDSLSVGGGMPELSSLFCVALRASCVRLRLRVSLPGSGPLSPSHKRQRSVR